MPNLAVRLILPDRKNLLKLIVNVVYFNLQGKYWIFFDNRQHIFQLKDFEYESIV